jgi:SAM-dependent methyltransferase
MSYHQSIEQHYQHGNLLSAIESALIQSGKNLNSVTIADLAPVDEFHIGGRIATEHLLSQTNFSQKKHLLDIGCGLGGAARFISNKYQSQVTGIDLTTEYIETGKALCAWLGLTNKVHLQQGSALELPFKDSSFDGAYMLHVGMNIEDKKQLFKEVYRILQPGSQLAIYDIMQQEQYGADKFSYPVPWASQETTSFLATAEYYKQTLTDAGFENVSENNRRDFALNFFQQLKEKVAKNGGLPPLGLHTLMQASTAEKIANMVQNISKGYISPVEIIVKK